MLFAKQTAQRNQNCSGRNIQIVTGQLTYYAKLRLLAVCIHKVGANLCKV